MIDDASAFRWQDKVCGVVLPVPTRSTFNLILHQTMQCWEPGKGEALHNFLSQAIAQVAKAHSVFAAFTRLSQCRTIISFSHCLLIDAVMATQASVVRQAQRKQCFHLYG